MRLQAYHEFRSVAARAKGQGLDYTHARRRTLIVVIAEDNGVLAVVGPDQVEELCELIIRHVGKSRTELAQRKHTLYICALSNTSAWKQYPANLGSCEQCRDKALAGTRSLLEVPTRQSASKPCKLVLQKPHDVRSQTPRRKQDVT